MKKSFLLFMCAALIIAVSCLPVYAKKGAEDWIAGNGYLINDVNSPVTISENDKGVQVSHGGYYKDGVNWGGVASAEKYDLDGLTAEVYFNNVPEANSDNWIYIGFLTKPQLFQVGDIPGNPGYVCLVRFNSGVWEHYESVSSFAQSSNQSDDSFYVKTGDTMTFEVKLVGDAYVLYLNGVKSSQTFSELPGVFPDGKAYLVISASQVDSPANCFTYTIVSVNGEKTVVKDVVETEKPAEDAVTETAVDTEPVAAAQTFDSVFDILILAAAAAGIFVISKKHK